MEHVVRKMSKMFGWYTHSWKTVEDFRYVTKIGLQEGKDHVYWRNRNIIRDILTNPENDDLFLDKDYFIKNAEDHVNLLTDKTMTNAATSVGAATIIFLHTILDTLITDLCKITKSKFPERWDDELLSCEVSFPMLKNNSLENIRLQLIDQVMKQVVRSSILDRMKFLFRRCKLGDQDIMHDYKFDSEKVKDFDKLRHRIVHGAVSITEVEFEFENDLAYINKTGLFFLFMVAKCYEIKLDPRFMINVERETDNTIG